MSKQTFRITIIFIGVVILAIGLGYGLGKGNINTNTITINSNNTTQHRININTASRLELESLDGIGEVKAKKIIDNRPYKDVWELSKIDGISTELIKQLEGEIGIE